MQELQPSLNYSYFLSRQNCAGNWKPLSLSLALWCPPKTFCKSWLWFSLFLFTYFPSKGKILLQKINVEPLKCEKYKPKGPEISRSFSFQETVWLIQARLSNKWTLIILSTWYLHSYICSRERDSACEILEFTLLNKSLKLIMPKLMVKHFCYMWMNADSAIYLSTLLTLVLTLQISQQAAGLLQLIDLASAS